MILTGKALEAFEAWLVQEGLYTKDDYRLTNALIIDWLDNVNIHISIMWDSKFNWFMYDLNDGHGADRRNSRPEATVAAISTANKIYNER